MRTLPLTAELIARLRTHWAVQQEERTLLDTDWKEHGLMFASEVGTPIIPRNLTRHFKVALEKAGLPAETRFHDLRHTAATMLADAGASQAVVAAILGHALSGVTANYTHISLDAMREAVERAAQRVERLRKAG